MASSKVTITLEYGCFVDRHSFSRNGQGGFGHFWRIDRAMETHESDKLAAKCLVFAKGERWKQLRQHLSPAFTRAKLRNILTTRMPSISREFHELIDNKYIEKPTDIKYLVEVTAGTMFGIRANSMQDKKAPILKLGLSFVDWTLPRRLEMMFIYHFPKLLKMFKCKLFSKKNSDFMRSLFTKILASRELEKPDLKTQSRDVVDSLLKLKDSESGYDFSEDDILAQAAIFFFGAFETTSSALTFICYELAFNQEYQDNLYKGIKTLKAKNIESDFDDIDGLKLLDMCIKDRLCKEDCSLSDGLVVEKGTRVLICTVGLHNDAQYYSEPGRWNPYRFEKENEMVPYTYMPFSEEYRICIGAKFAPVWNKHITSEYEDHIVFSDRAVQLRTRSRNRSTKAPSHVLLFIGDCI